MHILMVNHYAVTPDQSGGTRHYTLARELVRQGHTVTVLACAQHYQGMDSGIRADTCSELDGVRFLRLTVRGNQHGTVGRVLAMLDFARRVLRSRDNPLAGKPDVVYGSSPHLFAALAAHRLAQRSRVAFVLEIRDIWPQSIIELGGVSRYHPMMLAMSAIERHLYRRADEIVTLLPHSGQHIREVVGRTDGITVIPNLVDIDLHGAPAAADGAQENREHFTVLYAGAHGLANALDTVIDAAAAAKRQPAKADHIRFALLGAGPEKKRLRTRARELNLDNVAFHDPVPKQEVGARLAAADAFYMPLKASAVFKKGISPNKLFDYMAAARPVIFAVDTPSNPVAACRAGVTITPEDGDALLAAAVELASKSAAERRAMGERARAYVIEHHSPARMAQHLLSVLQRAVRS